MKSFLYLCFLVISFDLQAQVQITPLGVASLLIDDGETKLLFDAPFTRPKLLHWLLNHKLKPDVLFVKSILDSHQISKLDGVFVSHSHFDHAVDAPVVASLTSAMLYADSNLKTIAEAYKSPVMKISDMLNGRPVVVGKFQITPIEIHHEKVFGFDFLSGKVPKDFDFDFYDYKVGNTWMYLIEHEKGKILIVEAEKGQMDTLSKFRPDIKSVDVLVQGFGRGDTEALLNGPLKSLKPKIFIPTHFDNFFVDYDSGDFKLYPFSSFLDKMTEIKKEMTQVQVDVPKLGVKIKVLP